MTKEEKQKKNRTYYDSNSEKIIAKYRNRKRVYYWKNAERIIEKSKARYRKDPEKWKAYGRAQRKVWRTNQKAKLIEKAIKTANEKLDGTDLKRKEAERIARNKYKSYNKKYQKDYRLKNKKSSLDTEYS